jgi:DMSO/TMAO reductase YedYZ molybdopterin-dependent catalytic subunit
LVEGWPVLHYGGIPRVDLDSWELRVFGLVGEELRFDWEQVQALPQVKLRTDIHCVTTWSRYDNDWEGISFQHIMELARPTPEAKHVVFHCYGGYTTNVPLADLDREDVLLVHSHDGTPLSVEHGAPLRGMIPQLYFWKSAKWIGGIEFVAEDRPGFWEMYGYHMHGDPWTEERYG